jgi:hypothetical protein
LRETGVKLGKHYVKPEEHFSLLGGLKKWLALDELFQM